MNNFLDDLQDQTLVDAIDLIKRDQKIEAIKLLRDKAGLGLKEAKDLVEALSMHAGSERSNEKFSDASSFESVNHAFSNTQHSQNFSSTSQIEYAFNNEDFENIMQLIQENRQVEAIKYIKDHSNMDLNQAKAMLDNLENNSNFAQFSDFLNHSKQNNFSSIQSSQTFSININGAKVTFKDQQLQELKDLIQQNRKIEAVKYVKDHSDLGLKEAKDVVEQMQNLNHWQQPFNNTSKNKSTFSSHSNPQKPESSSTPETQGIEKNKSGLSLFKIVIFFMLIGMVISLLLR